MASWNAGFRYDFISCILKVSNFYMESYISFSSFLVIECYKCYEACIGPLWGRVRRVTTKGCFTVVKNMVSKHKVYDVSYPCQVDFCYSVWVTTHLWERGYRTLGSFTFFITLLCAIELYSLKSLSYSLSGGHLDMTTWRANASVIEGEKGKWRCFSYNVAS